MSETKGRLYGVQWIRRNEKMLFQRITMYDFTNNRKDSM